MQFFIQFSVILGDEGMKWIKQDKNIIISPKVNSFLYSKSIIYKHADACSRERTLKGFSVTVGRDFCFENPQVLKRDVLTKLTCAKS